MAAQYPELSSPVAGWSPGETPEANIHALFGARRGAPSAKQQNDAGFAPRAASGAGAASKGSLIAPFKERSSQSAVASKQQSGSAVGSSSNRKVLQPPMSHSSNAKPRPAVPLQRDKISSQAGSSIATSSTSSKQPAATPAATPAAAQQTAAGSRGNSSSSARPASRHAAASVAAAEAAVSAAAAVLKTHGPVHQAPVTKQVLDPNIPAVMHQQQHDHLVQQHQQQQQRSSKAPWGVGALREKLNSALGYSGSNSSTNSPEPGVGSSGGLSNHLLLEPLQVHAVSQAGGGVFRHKAAASPHATSQAGALGMEAADAAAGAAAAEAMPLGVFSEVVPAGPAQPSPDSQNYQQRQQQRHSHAQLLLYTADTADANPESAAAVLAAQAKSRRLKIQARSLQGPPAYQRGPVPPRPDSPPPVVLDGALLLASCPGAVSPVQVALADLSSSNISSVVLPAAAISIQTAADPEEPELVESAAAVQIAAFRRQGPELHEFQRLCSLDLSDNRLSCIAGLAWLPALWQLAVSANRLQGLQGLAQLLAETRGDPAAAVDGGSSVAAGQPQNGSPQPEQLQQQQQEKQQLQEQLQQQQQQVDSSVVRQPLSARCSQVFGCLQVLDVSYNMIPAGQLLGVESPLAHLPRLSELHAAGNSIASLPAVLGPFSCLSHLDLTHNRLTGAALTPLGQLPALQQLVLARNPIRGVPQGPAGPAAGAAGVASSAALQSDAVGSAGSASHAVEGLRGSCCTFGQLVRLDLCNTKVAAAHQLLPLLLLPRLGVLQLVGTPLAGRCWSNRQPVQELERPELVIVTHAEEPQGLWQHNSKTQPVRRTRQKQRQQPSSTSSSSSSRGRLLPVTVDAAATPGDVLAAAGKTAILGMQHQLLVAAFERVGQGIDSWQLPPVAEEDSSAWQEGDDDQRSAGQLPGAGGEVGQEAAEDEPIVDQTFITGVGITGQLPDGDDESVPGTSASAAAEFEDPTERLAVALGLQVSQLAHYTHKHPGNPLGAIHRLRHALSHPLVDPDAGQRPAQHHTGMTAAATAKQRPRQLLPLPQPIPVALDTRVVVVQDIDNMLLGMRGRLQVLEGTLLQQLQAQADKLSSTAQLMSNNAAAEAAKASTAAARNVEDDSAQEPSMLTDAGSADAVAAEVE